MNVSPMKVIMLALAGFAACISNQAYANAIDIKIANYSLEDDLVIVIGKLDSPAADQLVSLLDLNTGLVLAEIQTSKKNFQFRLTPQLVTPCAVMVKVGDASDSANVKNAPENCGIKRTLTGRIVDEPLPYATVKVTVGDQVFTTVANDKGEYSLDIVSVLLDSLVLIEATADNPNDPGTSVDLVSLAGTFSKILTEETVDVTNVTTASFILLIKANAGEPITTEEQLVTAEKSVDATELLQLAAVIKLIVDDPAFSIPEDEFGVPLFDNLIDFISDAAAVDTFIADVTATDPDNNPLTDMMTEIVTSSGLLPGFVAANIPARYYDIPASAPGFLARGGSALEFDQDLMTGQFLGQNQFSGLPIDQTFDWSVVDGRLKVIFRTPVSQVSSPFVQNTTATLAEINLIVNCAGVTQVDALVSTISITYTLLSNGELVDQVQGDSNNLTDYFPIPYDCGDGNSGTIDLPDRLEISSGLSGLRDGSRLVAVPFTPALVEGEWATHSFFDNEDTVFGPVGTGLFYEMVTHNADGSTNGLFSGDSNSWAIDNGDLVISYAGGVTHRMRILDQLDKEFGIYHEVTDGATRQAVYQLALKVNPAALFNSVELINNPGQFWGGMINSWVAGSSNSTRLSDGSLNPAGWFGWRLQASPVGDNVSSYLWDGTGDGVFDNLFWDEQDVTWTLQPNGYVELFRSPHGSSLKRRQWIPIEIDVAATGERRFYVMEWEDVVDVGRRINPRINIEQEFDIISWEFCEGCD